MSIHKYVIVFFREMVFLINVMKFYECFYVFIDAL
jgi:hypothetical protein